MTQEEQSLLVKLIPQNPMLPAISHGARGLMTVTDFVTQREFERTAVLGKTADRHTSAQFVEFLAEVLATQPAKTHIHIIADNLSTHKTAAVQDFLSTHPNVQLHYTPTYSSWLNQVEIWFSKIQRDLIARGIFQSKTDLHRQIMRSIRHYNKAALPFKWTYKNTDRRIR